MEPLLYRDLVPFYHLLDPLADHEEDGQEFGAILQDAVVDARSLLELGSGAGHGAHFVKPRFDSVTLVDLSPAMLDRSRTLNPDCEHLVGDMRAIRLERAFHCVLIHDAICYMTSPEDMRAMATTVAHHLRPGGAALLVPDCVTESFRESHEVHCGDDETRGLRCISWSYDPDPDDCTQLVDFAFLLRENGAVRAVHDRHCFGLFAIQAWLDFVAQAGLVAEVIRRPLPPEYLHTGYTECMFLCRKP